MIYCIFSYKFIKKYKKLNIPLTILQIYFNLLSSKIYSFINAVWEVLRFLLQILIWNNSNFFTLIFGYFNS